MSERRRESIGIVVPDRARDVLGFGRDLDAVDYSFADIKYGECHCNSDEYVRFGQVHSRANSSSNAW